MKRTLLYIIMCIPLLAMAGGPDCKSVVQIVSFNAAGDTLHTGYGFFTSADGEAVVPYSVMKGAYHAELTDWKGKIHRVTSILGASSTYDIVRLQSDAKKMAALSLASVPPAKGDALQQLYFTTAKKALPDTAHVVSAEPFNGHQYLTISTPNEARFMGCPLLNAQGEVVAIAQHNLDRNATGACAIDAQFVPELTIAAGSALNADLRSIYIPRALPSDEEEAFTYLYMLHRVAQDSTQFASAATLFCERYPANIKGLTETATFYANHRNYSAADESITAALKLGKQEDEVRSVLSDIIYQKALRHPQPAYADWTLERALSESERAYALRPDTAYLLQQAHCLFGLERYQEAHDRFLTVAKTSQRPAELYFYAADALERTGAEADKVIALLDSAMATFSRPYPAEAGTYLLARAQRLDEAGKSRAAVMDYNEYEKLIGARNLNARFYDIRQAAEQRARMYQQAIDDLGTAISLATTSEERADYQAEIAVVYLTVGMNKEAEEEAKKALAIMANHEIALKVIELCHQDLK